MSAMASLGCSCCGTAAASAAAVAGDCCASPSCATCGGPCLGVLTGSTPKPDAAPVPAAAPVPSRSKAPMAPPLFVRPWVPDPAQP